MTQATPPLLVAWQNFYVIAGSGAGALTGLQFVVIALIVQIRAVGSIREIQAFGTPTVVQFGTAFLLSALMGAPWPSLRDVTVCLAVCGSAGFLYSLRVIWHAWKATYQPDLEDWIWYTALPLAAHAALVGAALLIERNASLGLFAVAATTLVFLILGIHNSWDTVTYLAIRHMTGSEKAAGRDAAS